LEKTTDQLAAADIKGMVDNLQTTIGNLNGLVEKANSKDGSLGLLLNDKQLYQNLENTTRSLNILLDDVRVHPKRYINVSVFGRKDKNKPLQAPLNDSTQTTPQSQ
jgi:phospholipid/cholesterol/gamma-HCH transport system substrate-binding protein